jgi:hypothetical protein
MVSSRRANGWAGALRMYGLSLLTSRMAAKVARPGQPGGPP